MKTQQKRRPLKPLITFLFLLALYFLLNFLGIFNSRIDLSEALPSSLSGNSLSGDRTGSYLLENIDIAITPNDRRRFYVWEKEEDGDGDIGFQAYDYIQTSDNTCVGYPEPTINSATAGDRVDPAVATNDDGLFVVVWGDNSSGMTDYDIVFNLYGSDCSSLVTERVVNTTTTGTQVNPRVSMDNSGNFIIVWEGEGTGDTTGVFARGYNSSGTALDAGEYKVNSMTANGQQNPDVALDPSGSGEFLVVWDGECDGNGDMAADDSQGICAQGYKSFGTPVSGGNQLVNITTEGSQSNPRVAASKGSSTLRYVVAWDGQGSGDTAGIYARRGVACTASTCSFSNTEISVNTSTTGTQSSPAVDMNYQGDFAIAWLDENTSARAVKAQAFAYGGGTIGSELSVSNNNFLNATQLGVPALAMTQDGFFVIAWDVCKDATCGNASLTDARWGSQSYFGFLYEDTDLTTIIPENAATDALAGVLEGDVAYDPQTGNNVVVWSGDGDDGAGNTDSSGIWFTLRDKDGALVNSKQNVLVNSVTTGAQNSPKVAFFEDNSSFVICFDGAGDTNGDGTAEDTDGIFYRRYSSTGVALDSYDVQVNSGTDTYQDCDIDAGSGGGFVVTFEDTTNSNVMLSREGTGGDSTPINPAANFTPNSRQNPSVSMNSDNDWVWVWDGKGSTDSEGIFMQKGSQSAGLDSPSEIMLNASESGVHQNPAAHLNDDGLIFVVWDGQGAGDTTGVYGRAYNLNAVGNAMSTDSSAETLINVTTGGTENKPDMDGDDDGHYVVSWFTTDSVFPTTPMMRWLSVGAAEAITFHSPEVILDDFQIFTSLASPNVTGSTYNPVALNNSGELIVLIRGESNGDEWFGNAKKIPSGADPSLTSTLEQEVLSGGRTLVVPSSISFPAVTASAQTSTTNTVEVRDDATSSEDYIEIQDLFADGNSYSVTLSVGTPFTFSGTASDCTSNTLCIPNSNLEVRNYDQNGSSITTVFGSSENFSLDSSTDSFQDLSSQRTLATGTGTAVGRWRFYPQLRVTIPAETPPGNHTVTLTFSIN